MKYICLIIFGIFFISCGDDNKKSSYKFNNEDFSASYKEGDNIIIIKNSAKNVIDFRLSSLNQLVKEKKISLLKKNLESESCISLGFNHIKTFKEDAIIAKTFSKGFSTCTEEYLRDGTPVAGSFNVIFFIRKI